MSDSAPSVPPRPRSDVSAGVGLAGLAGLLGWVLVCRKWPVIAAVLGSGGPRLPMDGPYAALVAVLAAGVPMVAWSVLVDKVHRNASTGIDWTRPRPIAVAMDTAVTKLAGLWTTWAVIGALYLLCGWYWSGSYLFAMHVLAALAPVMFVGSIVYVPWLERRLVEPRDEAWHFGAMLIGREPWDAHAVADHWRAWAVKGFFCAFMIQGLPGNWAAFLRDDWARALTDPAQCARVTMDLMFLIDIQIAMVGYLLTMRPFDAQIRSANPLLAGWLAALACYPPFQLMEAGRPLFYQVHTAGWAYWLRGHPGLMWAWAGALVLLSGIYAWATVAFGLRFSNLTHRGLVSNGPYAWTRHPAYLAKNSFWWLETLPFLVTSASWLDAARNTFFLGCVSAIYYWRARTEERHLLAVDANYRAYHAWMAQHGAVTRRLGRIARWCGARRARPGQIGSTSAIL